MYASATWCGLLAMCAGARKASSLVSSAVAARTSSSYVSSAGSSSQVTPYSGTSHCSSSDIISSNCSSSSSSSNARLAIVYPAVQDPRKQARAEKAGNHSQTGADAANSCIRLCCGWTPEDKRASR
jgi:hypothetical protein